MQIRGLCTVALASLTACSAGDTTYRATVLTEPASSVLVATVPVSIQTAVVGTPYLFDASRSTSAFRTLRATGLSYRVTFAPSANGLSALGSRIAGIPVVAGTTNITVVATDATGRSAAISWPLLISGSARPFFWG